MRPQPVAHDAPPVPRAAAAMAGVLAVAVALGSSELAAALLERGESLLIAVGDFVIAHVPLWLERAVIAAVGTADKPLLLISIVLVSALVGARLGIAAARRFAVGAAGLAGLAGLGTAAALADPRAQTLAVLLTGLAYVLAGVGTLRLLLWAAAMRPRAAAPGAAQPAPERPAAGGMVDRRRFLGLAALAAVAAGAGAAGGQLLGGSRRVEEIRRAIRLPRPVRRAPAAPAGADLGVRGLTPLYVPNDSFYRIDTALIVPKVDPARWALEVSGRVARPFRLTYEQLLALPHIEADVTLACVSNEVGGNLVGNARWQGVPLRALLERAGPRDGAEQVVGRSVDGFTAGFPIRTALETRDAMVAVAMNGEPLPIVHGFPARLVVPGLYGYVSATKWLSGIELRGWDDFDGYWIPRGWSKEGPVKTQSRIDVPAASATVAPGRRAIAGVAWAPTRGIQRVEVRVDDGPWQSARLAAALDVDSWRQWLLPWDATPGRHRIVVRATDGTGARQTAEETPVAPDGATGHHTIFVTVS